MKEILVLASGYFNPIHKGHVEYFKNAKKLGAKLVVIVNNDFQRRLKGSVPFQDQNERMIIVSSLKNVDEVFLSVDRDRSVVKSITELHEKYNSNYDLVFCNGGDQFFKESPEKELCERLGISMVDGLGAKIQSSSSLLQTLKKS